MIQITKGTFGRRVGNKIVPTTAADGPFEVDKGLEARLVRDGIAVYVGKDVPVEPVEVVEVVETPTDNSNDFEHMSNAELKAFMQMHGIDIPKRTTKAALIDAIMDSMPDVAEIPTFDVEDVIE